MRIAALVLAAGSSRRFGAPKQLARFEGRPLVDNVVQRALAASVDEIVVVLGAAHVTVAGVLPSDRKVRSVINERYEEGLSTSLRCGVTSLGTNIDGAVVLLADVPEVSSTSIDLVAEQLRRGEPVVQVRYLDGPGHPVGFRRTVWGRLCRLSGDQGARGLLRAVQVTEVPVHAQRPRDIDRPVDLAPR